jgi:hypothetical protein
MKQEFLDSGEERIEVKERPIATPLSLDDVQGILYLAGLMIGFSILVFGIEMAIYGARKNKSENHSQHRRQENNAKARHNVHYVGKNPVIQVQMENSRLPRLKMSKAFSTWLD